MVSGIFIQDTVPLIPVLIAWDNAMFESYFVLDTGFTGDLQVTPQMAIDLGLQVSGVISARIANGETVDIPTAQAFVSMEDATDYVQVLISDSMPLAGISFLTKFNYRAVVDCKHKTVALERA
jgi:predicted aspartyl protease